MLAERYVGLFIARESLPTLALDRTFIWISFCCDCCPETSQIKPFMSEYIRKRVNGILYFSFSFVVVVLRLFHSCSSFFCSLLLRFVDSLLTGFSDLLSPIFFEKI